MRNGGGGRPLNSVVRQPMPIVHAKYKHICVACSMAMRDKTKEHFWPQWMIKKTNTHQTGVRFAPGKKINPRALTVPLCSTCNNRFGNELEGPVAKSFEDLEAGRGLSDREAERIIRWLWKLEGLSWCFAHPDGLYTQKYSLRDRVLNPIDEIRSELTLAVSLVAEIEPEFGDAPMGLDSWNDTSAIYVAGVFSRVALMVLLRQFASEVPKNFSFYQLADLHAADREAKLFFPAVGFATCVEAVGVTAKHAAMLSYAHELEARRREGQVV
jgi:hypothetical protein